MIGRLIEKALDRVVPVLLLSAGVLGVFVAGACACGLVALSVRVLAWGFGGVE